MRRHKYGAKPTVVDDIRFASMAEARRYKELKLLEKAGEITHLELQPKYEVHIRDIKVLTYVGDFRYFDRKTGVRICEDVKGMKTPVYRLKKKIVEAYYPGLKITEV